MLSTTFFFSIVTTILTVIFPVQSLSTDLHRKVARSLSNSSTSSLSLSNLTLTNSTTLDITEDSVYNADCNDEALVIVGQAINDAVHMAKTVEQIWFEDKYLPIFEKYMGTNCRDQDLLQWAYSKRH